MKESVHACKGFGVVVGMYMKSCAILLVTNLNETKGMLTAAAKHFYFLGAAAFFAFGAALGLAALGLAVIDQR